MINDILNGLGVTEVLKPEITSFPGRSGSSTSSRSTTATADASYTVALPNGQIARNLTRAQYDTIKALLDIYNEAFALAKSNGLSVPDWSEYTKDENAQNALAKLKAQIREKDFAEARAKADAAIAYQKNESAQTTPTEVVMPTMQPKGVMPTVQPPEEKQGSGILVPALIFAVGAIAAIVLVKSKPKRR